ncbi:hypothetical protein [Massilibacteroides vaginae]|uniref:hypothetical protein n=1 Tax=Massilibacteroides vaginae TaxID=1673718 RepID=UPI000A1CA5EB|nr:hypothetical protein [Massilibacteroides vaginae]
MEKIFITIIVLYSLFVAIYFVRANTRKRRKKNIVGQGSSIQETDRLKSDIVGKSRFDLSQSKPLTSKSEPLAASSSKSENPTQNPDTFVPSNEIKPSAEVPSEELDEAFSDTPNEEDNEPMDIDYPLEYEAKEESDDAPEDDEEETEEVEGSGQAALASGVQFEDLGNAVRTVNRTDEATEEQKEAAGNTLLEIRHTDMFEQLVSAKLDAKKMVTDLMAESLAAFHRRKDKEAGNTENGKKAPADFNVRDFA